MPDAADILAEPSRLERAPVARGLAVGERVDRTGGDNGAGIIRGLAVITRTEALGHGFWVDAEMLGQVHAAMTALGDKGLKSRFTHPGLSGDGLGTYLGRIKNPQLDGDVVRGDLHFSKSAHATTDGNLAAYVMDLAEEDPEAFGTSIVFRHDWEAEDAFYEAHTEVLEWEEPDSGRKRSRRVFKSPDPRNTDNLPHARLAELKADDIVDEPAANPDGLFHRQAQIGEEADALAAYALGVSDQKPKLSALSIDADRVSAHMHRFLDRNGLQVVPRQEVITVSDTTPTVPTRDELCAELDAYTSRFGAEKGLALFKAGTPMADAVESHNRELTADLATARDELAAKDEQITALQAEVAALKAKGGKAPQVEFQSSDSDDPPADELAADDDDRDALAASLWKANPSLRAEFTDEAAFKALFIREPDEFADLLN